MIEVLTFFDGANPNLSFSKDANGGSRKRPNARENIADNKLPFIIVIIVILNKRKRIENTHEITFSRILINLIV